MFCNNVDIYLCLGEVEAECEVEPLAHGQVARRLELVLEADQLLVSEGRARPPRLPAPLAGLPLPVVAVSIETLGGGGQGVILIRTFVIHNQVGVCNSKNIFR